ncbi:hypothetical protein BDQ17DRAFT_11266 [Cyathus striatus]|nr:hypothetical protein BDQ17DRAFT_11266 [Cyathus striatus]
MKFMGYKNTLPSRQIGITTPTGVLRVVVQSASLFPSSFRRFFNWPPCSFALVRLGDNSVSQTSVVKRVFQPNWISETHLFVVHSEEDTLRLEVRSYHRHWKYNTLLGYTSFDLLSLKEHPSQVGIQSHIVQGSEVTGSILFDIFFHPVDLGVENPHVSSGIVSFYILQAEELQIKEPSTRVISTLSLGCDDPLLFETSRGYSENPAWNEGCHFICLDRNKTTIIINVINAKFRSESFGHVSISLNDPLDARAFDGWWTMTNCKAGRLQLKVEWRPIDLR